LTDIILCEVLQGVRDDLMAKEVEGTLLQLEVFETGSVALAREAARNYRGFDPFETFLELSVIHPRPWHRPSALREFAGLKACATSLQT
jgi:hypothetical protein